MQQSRLLQWNKQLSTLLKPKWLEEMSEHEKKWVNKMSLNTKTKYRFYDIPHHLMEEASPLLTPCLGRVRAAVAGMAH